MKTNNIIHPVLTESFERLRAYFEADERCVGMFLWGSLDNGTADAWSDVDVSAVFRDEDYQQVKAEMRSICDSLCGPILVWLPEGETKEAVNFAFLFNVEDRVHLYDFSIFSVKGLKTASGMNPHTVYFDKVGLFQTTDVAPSAAVFDPKSLLQNINNWWVYTYLNGKYYRRQDTYKMLYVQQVIFATHMRVINAQYPDSQWNWPARDVHHLPVEQQEQMLTYFPAPDPRAIADALQREMDLFSHDAIEACARWDVEYPHDLESGVRRHFKTMGLTL
jgi:hypothetical protein